MHCAGSSGSVQPRKPEFLSSFGRNRGKSLRPYQQSLVDDLLPRITAAGMPDMAGYTQLALEIGFGGGEHLLAQAAHNPDTLFIGVEPYINGVAKCLAGIDKQKLGNIRLNTQDARLLIKALPDACLDAAFILFPDPWPKARHNKRRLVNLETLAMLARAQKPGARLLIASDHEDYCVWILEHLAATPHYRWTAEAQADWLTPPADWTETKYQRKTTAQGRPPHFFECVRV
ncbi:MAG: tRNA (guanosine(46)-N7)-methyltransferase TrmB [Azospirillum brasilense]|nr:MAG: tRNA (guanosine(46)-N7)-methyltransferase TrmB [Azospirillum brasilense]